MRFDLPLTAFALESSGAAACALGASHTLTLPLAAQEGAEQAAATEFAPPATGAPAVQRACVPREAPPALTITL